MASYRILKRPPADPHAAIDDGIDDGTAAQADRPLGRASMAVAGWAGGWLGCKVVGAGGAKLGTLASPLGTAISGIGGCLIGGIGGHHVGSVAAAAIYDWAEETRSIRLDAVPAP